MWLVEPKLLCRKHLFGEHVELHMLVGTIKRGTSLRGFVEKGLIDTRKVQERHNQLVTEMVNRGYKHQSVLDYVDHLEIGSVSVPGNIEELKRRCPECRKRIQDNTFKIN